MKKIIKIQGEALKILYDFLKYAELNPEKLANAMNYDLTGFKIRTKQLYEAYKNAEVVDDDWN